MKFAAIEAACIAIGPQQRLCCAGRSVASQAGDPNIKLRGRTGAVWRCPSPISR
jgi:hypothetical protein